MKKVTVAGAACVILLAIIFRFLYPSPFAGTWDEVDFSLALDRYDIAAMQPHFPGYPFFILGATVIHFWVTDPAKALSIWNAFMVMSACIPMYLLAKMYVKKEAALVIVAVLQTSSYLNMLATQPMSEGMAIALLWWYVWSIERAFRNDGLRVQIMPLLIFAFLMGVRLSYVPFGIALILLWWKKRKDLLILIPLSILLQLIWVSALVWNVGSVDGLLKLAFGFVDGHFTKWGGTVVEAGDPLLLRMYRLLTENIVWSGLFAHSSFVAILFLFFLPSFVLQWKNIRFRTYHTLFVLWFFYFIWNLLGQNIDKPRHSYPLVSLGLFLFLCIIAKRRFIFSALLVFAGAQLWVGAIVMQEQATKPPATYQLAAYIKEPATVYTWEETRVLAYLHVPYEHKRVYQYGYFLQDVKERRANTVYVTNHLLEGFKTQGMEQQRVKKLATFTSNPLFDPVYSKITLYEWGGNK